MTDRERALGKARIMIVDDAPEIIDILTDLLEDKAQEIISFANGPTALAAAEINPPDLILLDVLMPGLDGYEVCIKLKQDPRLADIPIIFLSGQNTPESKVKAFHLGGVDYITKPFDLKEVEARICTHLQLNFLQKSVLFQKLTEERFREMTLAQQATIFALAKLAEARDDDTGKHLERVRTLCRILAENLKTDSLYSASILPDFVDTIKHAAPLHDIGKVAIPDNILLKPGKFTPDEIEIIQTHTITGAEYLQDVYNNYPNNVIIGMGIEIALYHHERWDGSGYPDGLVGSNIPLSARIMAVVDVYDALRSDRCYRKGFPHQKVIEMILEESGTHFDPEVCKSFVAAEEKFEAVFNELLG